MAKSFRGDKRRREIEKKRKKEEKRKRMAVRKDLRARGLDPDLYDDKGNPLPDPDDPNAALPAGEEDAEDRPLTRRELEGKVFEIHPEELQSPGADEDSGGEASPEDGDDDE